LQRHQLFYIDIIMESGAENCLQRHQLFNIDITLEPGAEHCLQRHQLFNYITTRELETSLAGKAARVAELEADRLEIETIRMKEMDMVIALRDEVENSKKQHAQVARIFCLRIGRPELQSGSLLSVMGTLKV
jgi:hypothetical protein